MKTGLIELKDQTKVTSLAVFTVCNLAYLPRALVLAESLALHENRVLKIVLFDAKVPLNIPKSEAEIIWIEDLDVPNLLELAFMYDIIEFSTSLKPFIARKFLDEYEAVIFLDPDTCIFNSLCTLVDDLEKHSIVVTPHYTTPQPRHPAESDLAMMRFGSFNLGFFAVRRAPQGLNFLEWWSARSIDYSFMESQFGLSTDQKWVSIAPCFFNELHVSFNLGYNVAPWNTFERDISVSRGSYRVNGIYPLVFFHFSNFDADDVEYLNKRASSESGKHYPALKELGTFYAASLAKMSARITKMEYAFDYMSDGTYLSPTLRRAYAAVRSEMPKGHDPFDANGPVGAFARKNGLATKNARKYVYPRLADAANHGFAFKSVYLAMRIVLRLFGPLRFYDLTILMVYLSLLRRNRGLWKF
jgi:hypothetical protein